jgi:hypothetical protein
VIPVRYELNVYVLCFHFVVITLRDSCEVRTESRFNFVVVTLCDSCEVRTDSRFHFVVVTLCYSSEVRTESRFHFVVVSLCYFCEVRTESRFNFVVVTLCYSSEVRTESRFHFLVVFPFSCRPNLFVSCNNTFRKLWEGLRMCCRRVLSSTPLRVWGSETLGDSTKRKLTNATYKQELQVLQV